MLATILLVDDNKEFIDNIKDLLEDEDYDVFTAHSGEEACSLAEKKLFDLVLMDIKMPGMDGVECFLQMKKKDPDIKVVLFTAYALEELIQKARDNGVIEVFKKPLDLNLLIQTIKEAKKRTTDGCVLIADDDQALCENLYDVLTEHGYRVATVHDGQSAISKAKTHNFDVMLLDLKMPELNGLEVYGRIKSLCPSLITILMTGYADEMKEFINQALQENVYTLLQKPIDMNQLLKLVTQVIKDKKNGAL